MNSTLVTILGGLLFFALILVSVGLHELGHFIPGKLFKVRVLQFFIGFGKNIWTTHKGETEYGVKILPLGGYVRMLGMYPPYKEGKNTWLKRVADNAREGEWEEITDEDVAGKRLFYQKPLWQRMVIMFSGVGINLLLAFALFLGVNLGYGQEQQSMTISQVYQCAGSTDPSSPDCVTTPAYTMGLKPGDRLVGLNGIEYDTWVDLTAAVRANEDGMVQLSIIRDGVRIELPQVQGLVSTLADPDNEGQTIRAGFLGVTAPYELVKVGPAGTAKQMWTMTVESVKAIGKLPVTAVTVLVDMFTGQPRDRNGPISIVGASVIAGDVASMDAPMGSRVAMWVGLLGSINLFVGLLNLVPLLPFDGGQVAAGIYEAIRRGIAKLRGKPDPGPADTAKLIPVAYVMFGLLTIIGVILIVADIVSPVSFF